MGQNLHIPIDTLKGNTNTCNGPVEKFLAVSNPSVAKPEQAAATPSGQKPTPRRPWLFHPLLQVSLSIVLTSASQILFKVASNAGVKEAGISLPLLTSWALWAGIVATLTSLVIWLSALRSVPLIIAYNLGAATYIL